MYCLCGLCQVSIGGWRTNLPREDRGVRYAGGVRHFAARECCPGAGAHARLQHRSLHQPVHCEYCATHQSNQDCTDRIYFAYFCTSRPQLERPPFDLRMSFRAQMNVVSKRRVGAIEFAGSIFCSLGSIFHSMSY